jgi:hypothetical protein
MSILAIRVVDLRALGICPDCSKYAEAVLLTFNRSLDNDRTGPDHVFRYPQVLARTGAAYILNKRKTLIKRRRAILIQSTCGWRILVNDKGDFRQPTYDS